MPKRFLTIDLDTGALDSSVVSEISAAVAALVAAAPGALDTLNELAAALGDDPNFATTIAASIAAVQADATQALADAAAAADHGPFDVTNAQRLAGTRGDGTTPLIHGNVVRVTNQGNRIELYRGNGSSFANDQWEVLVNTFEMIIDDSVSFHLAMADTYMNGVAIHGAVSLLNIGWVKDAEISLTTDTLFKLTDFYDPFSGFYNNDSVLRITSTSVSNVNMPFPGPLRGVMGALVAAP